MIDKNGKLFGKINLIDLLILLVLIAVVVFVAMRFFVKDESGMIRNDPVRIEYTASEIRDFVADELVIGAPVKDMAENTDLGTLVSVETGEAYYWGTNDKGDTVRLTPDDSVSVVFASETVGNLDGNGVVINGTRYAAGHTMVVYAGNAKVFVRVSGVYPAG